VHRGQLGKVTGPDATVAVLLKNVPDVLGARALKVLLERLVTAHQAGKRISPGLGARSNKRKGP